MTMLKMILYPVHNKNEIEYSLKSTFCQFFDTNEWNIILLTNEIHSS